MGINRKYAQKMNSATFVRTTDPTATVTTPATETVRVNNGPIPYTLYCKEKRPEIIANNPGASFGEIGRLLGLHWGNYTNKDKQV